MNFIPFPFLLFAAYFLIHLTTLIHFNFRDCMLNEYREYVKFMYFFVDGKSPMTKLTVSLLVEKNVNLTHYISL